MTPSSVMLLDLKTTSIQVFDGYLHLIIHIKEIISFSAGSVTGRRYPHELLEIHSIQCMGQMQMELCQH